MFKIFIDCELPHKKSREEQFEFVKKLHEEINKLDRVKMFNRAIVSIIVCLPQSSTNQKTWDVDNRAIHLILNNLKGIFFKDDDYDNVSLFVCGKQSQEPETVILIDTYSKHTELIWETMKLHKYYNSYYGREHKKHKTCEWKNGKIYRTKPSDCITYFRGYPVDS